METKDIVAILGIVASITTGVIWCWKYLIKPSINFVKKVDTLSSEVEKLEFIESRITYVDRKADGIIHLSDHAMFVCDGEGLCILANVAVCELFGASENQMKGYGWLNFLHPDDRKMASEVWKESMQTGSTDIKARYRIIHGHTEEEIEAVYHAIISRDEESKVIISIGRVNKH